ncbi:MAG: cbb3-type cytochrome oxidase assembly protein CcoS [Pseudomonadales bacterium]|jgi:cbb3-type cytochrome oxidase maturation protein
MEILLLLIPLSLLLVGLAAATFVWAVNHGQFDQLDQHGFDILDEQSGETDP